MSGGQWHSGARGLRRPARGDYGSGVHIPSHQLTWKCKQALSKRKVVFLQGSVHFHVSWWEGIPFLLQECLLLEPFANGPDFDLADGCGSVTLRGKSIFGKEQIDPARY